MKTPDLTTAQIKADVALVLGIATAIGLNIDGQTSQLITAVVIGAFALLHFASYFADAKLRSARAHSAYEIGQAQAKAAYNDPVAAVERIEKTIARLAKALDAQSVKGGLGSSQESAVKIPATEVTGPQGAPSA